MTSGMETELLLARTCIYTISTCESGSASHSTDLPSLFIPKPHDRTKLFKSSRVSFHLIFLEHRLCLVPSTPITVQRLTPISIPKSQVQYALVYDIQANFRPYFEWNIKLYTTIYTHTFSVGETRTLKEQHVCTSGCKSRVRCFSVCSLSSDNRVWSTSLPYSTFSNSS